MHIGNYNSAWESRPGHETYETDMTSQARQVEASRRPIRRRQPSTTAEPPSHAHDQASGLSLKTLFSRTMSFKVNPTSTSTGRPVLARDSSKQRSLPEYTSTRLSSLTSDDSRITTSLTMESCWPPRERASWDPPPLFQAYPQALRHALLDSPASSIESILRRQAFSTSGGSTTPTNLDEASIPQKKTKKHTGKTRPSADSAWTRKLYILVTSGYVLQYAADGHHDRLPEKILPLGHNSVAFASDAISGRPYVLQISRNSEQGDARVDPNTKNIWSRIGFRTAEEKRMAGSFLLVCECPDELDAWMIAVRREIEARGGAHYRSKTPRAGHEESITAYQRNEQSQPCQDVEHIHRNLPTRSGPGDVDQFSYEVNARYEPLPEIKTLSGLWSDQALFRRHSSIDSSVNTATELDDLRESSQRSSSTATGHRPSLDESSASLSPAEAIFRETYTALTRSNDEAHIYHQSSSVQEDTDDLWSPNFYSPEQVPAGRSEQARFSMCDAGGRPVSVVPNFSLPNLSQRYSRSSVMLSDTSSSAMSEILDLVDCREIFETVSATEAVSTRPTSTIAPLPSRETLARSPRSRIPSGEHASRRTSLISTTLASSPSPLGQQNISDIKATPRSPTTVYSLFPKRHSSSDVLKLSPECTPAENDLTHKRSLSTPWPEEPTNLLKVPASRAMRRPTSMQLDLRNSLEMQKPERSPAVTDLHFATNFGTANPFDRSSSISGEPTCSCLPQVEVASPSMQEATRPTRRKAASNSAITGPPAGPPPTCPLPAPPSVHTR